MMSINPIKTTSYSSVPVKASCFRKAREIFGIVQVALCSLRGWFLKPSSDVAKTFKSYDLTMAQEEKYRAAIRLQKDHMLGSETVEIFIKEFISASTNSSTIGYFDGFLKPTISELSDFPGKDLVLVPVVIKGLRDHITVFAVDKKNKTIEFYDSKGLTINDRKSDSTKYGNKSLLSVYEELVSANFPERDMTVMENKTKHQSCGYNCGVHVLNFCRERIKGTKFEDYKGISFVDACTKVRDQFIQFMKGRMMVASSLQNSLKG